MATRDRGGGSRGWRFGAEQRHPTAEDRQAAVTAAPRLHRLRFLRRSSGFSVPSELFKILFNHFSPSLQQGIPQTPTEEPPRRCWRNRVRPRAPLRHVSRGVGEQSGTMEDNRGQGDLCAGAATRAGRFVVAINSRRPEQAPGCCLHTQPGAGAPFGRPRGCPRLRQPGPGSCQSCGRWVRVGEGRRRGVGALPGGPRAEQLRERLRNKQSGGEEMSHAALEINGAAGSGGQPGRLVARGLVGKEEPGPETPRGVGPAALLGGRTSRTRSKTGGFNNLSYIQREAAGRGGEGTSLPAGRVARQSFPVTPRRLRAQPSPLRRFSGLRLPTPAPAAPP